MAGNKSLAKANKAKEDEFYTQLADIELELKHYRKHFAGKTIFCNCDDPYESNFFKYFAMNFNFLGLKKLIATCYKGSPIVYTQLNDFGDQETISVIKNEKRPYKIEITEILDINGDGAVDLTDVEYLLRNKKNSLSLLDGDGDFRSPECVDILKQADVVVTNPPFSLFREYIAQLIEYFSKNQCIAYKIGERYMNGSTIRQDYLQTVLSWISAKENKTIEQYMAEHQHDTHSTPLKQYFKTVIDWIELTFPKYRAKLMKGLNWGILYNEYGNNVYDPNELESEINRLLQDDDITKQKGIYEYLLSGKTKEKALSIRAFTDNEKMTMYERQKGICPMCKAEGKDVVWAFEDMHADHKIPWCKGGHTTLDNGQMLCREHNLEKSDM